MARFEITRNGRTTVYTGWRAWAFGAGVLIVVWLALALVAFALIGAAITVGLALLLLVPAALIAAIFGQSRRW